VSFIFSPSSFYLISLILFYLFHIRFKMRSALISLVVLAGSSAAAAKQYVLSEEMTPDNFFDKFESFEVRLCLWPLFSLSAGEEWADLSL
jgi:hypothetical protein